MLQAQNPLREGLAHKRRPEPFAMVIFGANGDLAHRKLAPALYNLFAEGWLPDPFGVIGFSRGDQTREDFQAEWRQAVTQFSRRPLEEAVWSRFQEGLYRVSGDFQNPTAYHDLANTLSALDEKHHWGGRRLFYLATPPGFFSVIAEQLGGAGLNGSGSDEPWTRIIVEKPFGRDLTSAQALNQSLHQVFDESQIYRIDHYLGKETVQNLLAFRFANGIFEPLWNRQYIDQVQITVAESLGVEGRGGYYDQAGALRDMVQNHMMQLLTLIAMEPPTSFEANAVRNEKVKVLHSIHPFSTRDVQRFTVRAQYDNGFVDGEAVPGYLDEPDVAADSLTETFVALQLTVDNWRWAGVPFYLRTGKRLAKRVSEIIIQFKQAPLRLFGETATANLEPNLLTIRLQPDEGMQLRFAAKVPGAAMRLQTVNMDFLYGTSFAASQPEAYERLLLDAMLGDSTLFTRTDEVETAWAIFTPILESWKRSASPLAVYESGSWGPEAATELLAPQRFHWWRP